MNKKFISALNIEKKFEDLNELDNKNIKVFGVSDVLSHKYSHSHNVMQLSSPVNGIIYILIENKLFIVPRGYAVLIPANTLHAVEKANSKTIVNSMYFNNSFSQHLPKTATTFRLSLLANTVITQICSYPNSEFNKPRVQNLLNVLLDEFQDHTSQSYALIIPYNKILYKVYQLFINSQDYYPTLDECAKHVNFSTRTLLRLFKEELNISFIGWKQQFLFIKALALLEKEKSTSSVAYKLGYNSDSAFITMFKKMSGGKTPSMFI